MTTTLVLGGARSGKSTYAQHAAESAAEKNGGKLVLVATAEVLDAEMNARITHHQAKRGAAWRTIEAPVELPQAISKLEPADLVVVDCLTLWVNNLLMREMDIEASIKALTAALGQRRGSSWLVSNEVGLGIVPANALARRFR